MNEQNKDMVSGIIQSSAIPGSDNNFSGSYQQNNTTAVNNAVIDNTNISNNGMNVTNNGLVNNINTGFMNNNQNATMSSNVVGTNNQVVANTSGNIVSSSMNNNINSTMSNLNENMNNQVISNKTEGSRDNMAEIISVKKYLGYIILFMIPIVGFIMLIVKAFDKEDKNISNYAKAQLLLSFIAVIFGVIISVLSFISVVGV